MTDIKFDQGAATALADTSRKTARVIADEGKARGGAVTAALDGFDGPYKNSFERVCGTEETDRKNLGVALETLAKKVEETAAKAEEEQKRLNEVRAWEQRRAAGVPTGYVKEVSCYGPMVYKNPPNNCPIDPKTGKQPSRTLKGVTTDPEPSRIPILPPSMEVSFSAQTRDRSASGAKGTDTVSAKPAKLRDFVTQRTSSDKTMADAIANLQSSWSSFTSKCSWANFSDVNIFSGISTYQEENHFDRTWVAGIADAFRKAGSGTVDVVDIQVQLAGQDPRYKDEAKRSLNDPTLTEEEIYKTAKRLANIPGNENILGEIATEWNDNIYEDWKNKSKTGGVSKNFTQNVLKFTALLQGISTNKEASAATLKKMGGVRLVDTTSMAASWSSQEKLGGTALPNAIKSVFFNGEPTLGKRDPEASRKLAREMASVLDRKRNYSSDINDSLALSFLLHNPQRTVDGNSRGTTLSEDFLVEMGSNLERIEREQAKKQRNKNDFWRGLADRQQGALDLFDEADRGNAWNLITNYFNTLSYNPSASLKFFTGTAIDNSTIEGVELTPEQAIERQRYWFEQRSWAEDHFTNILSAVDAATTDPSVANTPLASGLISSLVEMLANRNQGKTTDGKEIKFDFAGDYFTPDSLNAVSSDHLSNIINTYMPAVDYYLNTDFLGTMPESIAGEKAFFRNGILAQANAPVFRQKDIKTVLRGIAGTDEGIRKLYSIGDKYHTQVIKDTFKQYNGTPEYSKKMAHAASNDAGFHGFLVNAIGTIAMARGAHEDQILSYYADLRAKAAKKALEIIPLYRGFAADVTDMAIDAAAANHKYKFANNEFTAQESAAELVEDVASSRLINIEESIFEQEAAASKEHGIYKTIQKEIDQRPAVKRDLEGIFEGKQFIDNKFPDKEVISSKISLRNIIVGHTKESGAGEAFGDSYMNQFIKFMFDK